MGRIIKPRGKRILVEVPGRAHLSVLDMTRFKPGVPGGGGIGFPLPFKSKVEVSISDSFSYSGPKGYEEGVRRVLEAFKEKVCYEGNFSIKFEKGIPSHSGLGSHTSLYTGALFGANMLLGRPCSLRDLRFIIGENYFEENGPGFETGVGPAAILYSGFAILSDLLEILIVKSLPKGAKITVVIPRIKRKIDEKELLLEYGRILDEVDGAVKAKEVLLNLYPSLLREEWERVGESVYKLQFLGSKVAEIAQYDEWEIIYKIMRFLRDSGAFIVGMSSLGPAIVSLSFSEIDLPKSLFGKEIEVLKGSVSNSSLSFSINPRNSLSPLLDKI